jgi:hypothetical protein
MPYSLTLPNGSVINNIPDEVSRGQALENLKAKMPDAFPAPPGIGEQLLGLPAEIGKGFIRGLTVDPASGIASLGYTGARAAGADLTPFEQTGVGKGLASLQKSLAPSDEGLITQFGSGLGSLASFIPGGLLKGGIGLATKLAQSGGVGSEEARSRAEEARVMGEADATAGQQLLAQLGGTVIGFGELASLKRLTDPIEQILRGVKKSDADVLAPTLFNAGQRMLVTGGIEGFQEGMANIAQDLVAKGIYNPNLQVGESALGDAAMGASVGAFAQGAIDLVTRGKRRQLYEQVKEQEEFAKQAEEQRIAAEQQAVLDAQERQKQQQAMQALGAGPQIDPQTGRPILLLSGPSPEVNLQDPLGVRFGVEDLGPKVVSGINRARKERGLPPTQQFTIEDLMEAGSEKDAPMVSEMLARKIGYDPSVQVSQQSIFDLALSKNIDVETPGFADFLRRTTGSPDVANMTAPQLFAAQQSLSALPTFTETTQLPTGSQATSFDDKTYKKTVDGLKKTVLNTGPLGRSQTIEEIKGFSGLTETRDAERLLDTALRRGDLGSTPTQGITSTSINISLPTAPGVAGPDIRQGDYMDTQVAGYEVSSDDGKFKQVRSTIASAESLISSAQEGRQNTVEKLTGELEKTQATIDSNREKLNELDQIGEQDSAGYKKIESNTKNLVSKVSRLNEKIQSVSQPLQIKAKQEKKSRKGFTLFEGGKPVGTYPTQEDAEIAAVAFRTDEELDGIINAAPKAQLEGALEQPFGEQPVQVGTVRGGMPRRLYDEAVKEKDRRYRSQAGLPPPAAPVKIKITGDAQAAAERLRASGITVRFMPEVEKEIPEINKRLRAVLDKLGLKDIRLNIVDSLKAPGYVIYGRDGKPAAMFLKVPPGSPEYAKTMATLNQARAQGLRVEEDVFSANGSYAAKLIEIALDSKNPIRAARHEAIHALKELGFFTPQQWAVLERKAKSEWLKKYNIEGSGYGSLSKEGQIEEAIADAFSDFDQETPPTGQIGILFNKVKKFFEALGNAFRGSGFQTASDVFTLVEEGRLTGPGTAVAGETRYSLDNLQQYVTPEAAEGVLRRRAARAEGFGAPINERVIIGTDDNAFAVGKITPSDWRMRVEGTMTKDEVIDARNWYQQLRNVFEPLFGPKASEYSLAWLLSQQRASPTKGFTDVLRASDIAQNKLRIKKAGLNEKALVSALRGEIPEGGIGSKLLDFIDSELGRTTRTVVRGAPEGRQPAAIDVWAQRDIGFVDDVIKKFVARKYGNEAANKLEIDTARFGEPQYEYGVDFYNNVAEYLNQQNYLDGGWTASEVQAVGWVNMQMFVGVKPEFVRDIINGNTRRISLGLTPGAGTPMVRRLMGKEIPVSEAIKVIEELARASNVKITQTVDGVGAYLTYIEGSIQIDTIGSPESVQDFMDMIGYAFQQTEMISTRPLASGKNSAIDIVSPSLNTQDKAIKFFTEYLNAMPKDSSGDPIAPGFQQIKVDGVPGIRLLNFGGKWNKKQLEALENAAVVAEKATGIKDAEFVSMNVQFTSAKNNWVKYPNGDQYVNSLRNRGRLQETELLQREFPPARFDLAGDGSINWRPRIGYEPKLSLRLDELVGGPSIGSGISIRPQQPTAQSFDAVHYGKQRVETLFGSMYGTGIKGAEAQRVFNSDDPRVRQRAYFYIPFNNGRMPKPEAGLGQEVHVQRLNNLLGPGPEMQGLASASRTPDGQFDENAFESSVIDAGYDGYAVPNMGMAVVLGSDVPVVSRGTRQEVEAKPDKDKIQIGDRKYSLRQTDTKEFKDWFGDSKIVNGDSTPKVMYHGTARDIGTFKPKQADAIFVTDDPSFAGEFAMYSENYMVKDLAAELDKDPKAKRAILEPAIDAAIAKDNLATAENSNGMFPYDRNYWINEFMERTLRDSARSVGLRDELEPLLTGKLSSNRNIMPLFIRAENTFDYDNEDHIKKVTQRIFSNNMDLFNPTLPNSRSRRKQLRENLIKGEWETIESDLVQEVLKELKFDSFYAEEKGIKNLAVYDPNQVKSAIGNLGTFSRTNNDIRYSLALEGLKPSSALIPDEGGNPSGNLGFMPEKLGGKPIRLLVGTHNDLVDELVNEKMYRPVSYGGNHILNRIMSYPRREPIGAEELLEKIARAAQKTSQTYTRIYKDGKRFILFDGKNSLILGENPDSMSIITMYTQTDPNRRYGNPAWFGRAPVVPEFVGAIRGTKVEAKEGRIAPSEVDTKAKRVYTPSEVGAIAAREPTKEPTKGTLSLNKKMSLRVPDKTVTKFFDDQEQIPMSEGVEIIRDNWIGGVSGIGDRDGVYYLDQVYGGPEYTQQVQDLVRKDLGESFKGYRLMSQEEFEELQTGAIGTQLASVSLVPETALAIASIPQYSRRPKGDLIVVELDLTPDHVQMVGHVPEKELIIDYGIGYDPTAIEPIISPVRFSLKDFDRNDLPKGDARKRSVYTLPAGTKLYHGSNKDTAAEIKKAGHVLLAEPPYKSSGGDTSEGYLIWFGDKEIADRYAEGQAEGRAARDKKEPGEVFATVTNEPMRLVEQERYELNAEQAKKINDFYKMPDYKLFKAGENLGNVSTRLLNHSDARAKAKSYTNINGDPQYSILKDIASLLGFDGYYYDLGVALPAEKGISLGLTETGEFVGEPMKRFSLAGRKSIDTDSENFKRFFGNSKAVDNDNNPIILYHGTAADIDKFKIGKEGGALGNGIYLSPSTKFASEYATKEGGNIVPVYASIQNPLIIDGSISADNFSGSVEALVRLGVDRSKADRIVEKAYDEKGYITNEVKIRATNQGYDGIFQYRNGELSEVVAFNPNQVKSSISNIGAFDPTDPRIRYSLQSFGLAPTDAKDNAIFLLQDKNIDLKRIIEGIRKNGKILSEDYDAYRKEELFHGRSATLIKFFLDRELRPLLQKMQNANISLEQMDDYLLARHAKEANAYIRKVNPDKSQNSGMTDKEADDFMKALPTSRRNALDSISRDIDAITKKTREIMVDTGLESQNTVNQWEKTYKNYVPLFREEIEDGRPISLGRGFDIRGSTTRQRMGSSRKVVDVLANIAMQRERTIVRGEKNRIGKSLYGLILDNPHKGFWGVINPEKMSKQAMRTELSNLGLDPNAVDDLVDRPPKKVINKSTGLVSYEVPQAWKSAPNIFATRINGEDRFMIFNKQDERAMRMVATLKSLDAQQQGEAIKMMGTAGDYYRKSIGGIGTVTRYFAQINTQYNPAFGIYNLMRDIGGAVLNLQTTPLKGQEAKVVSDALIALKAVYQDLRRQRQGLGANSKWASIFEEFESEGGKTGYRDLFETSESRAESLQQELKDFGQGKIRGSGKAVMGWLSDFNDAIENSVRVSVYHNAKQEGLSNAAAASLAKNITVNFNRSGAVSRNFQTLFAFFNASIQGTARIAQTLLTSEGKLSPTGKKIVMGGITLGIIQAALLAMAGLDEDEVPDFVKDKSFVIPYGDGKYFAIPMPLGYNVIPSFGRRVMEFAMSDEKNVGKAVFDTSSMIIDGFNPLGSATFVQTLTPTILDPIVALAENKDFTGKPISRDDINSLSPTPGYTRGSQNSFAITEALAYGINILTGGSEFKKGALSPTPDQIEYLVGEAFSGVGREALKVGRGIESLATGEELATYNVPIVGRLTGNVQQQAAQRSKFFNNIRRLNEHQAEIEGRLLQGDDISDYIDQYPESSLYQAGDKIYNQITKLRRTKKVLEESGAGKDDLKSIDETILSLMSSLNEIYDSARQQ